MVFLGASIMADIHEQEVSKAFHTQIVNPYTELSGKSEVLDHARGVPGDWC